MFKIRQADSNDLQGIYALYKKVAQEKIGIARTSDEITESYILDFMDHAFKTGIQLVIENPADPEQLIAEIHCYKLGPKTFGHVLGELTIVVDQDFHGKGVGKHIFSYLLNLVTHSRPDILRIELVAQESNTKAIEFYKKLGFAIEGRFEKRIKNHEGNFEPDIPMAWFNKNYSA